MTMASGVYGPFLRDAFGNVKAFALNASDTVKWQPVADAYTPNFDVHDEEADITNEVTGTGYTTGGEALASPTFAIGSGFATFDSANISLAATTLASVEGLVLFDDTVAGDPLLNAIDFGATFNTVIGTFAVTWDALGIWRIKYTL